MNRTASNISRLRRYDIRCSDCSEVVGHTDDVRESYAGGRCGACKVLGRVFVKSDLQKVVFRALYSFGSEWTIAEDVAKVDSRLKKKTRATMTRALNALHKIGIVDKLEGGWYRVAPWTKNIKSVRRA